MKIWIGTCHHFMPRCPLLKAMGEGRLYEYNIILQAAQCLYYEKDRGPAY